MHDVALMDAIGPTPFLAELKEFVRRGGPEEHEYTALSQLFERLHHFTLALGEHRVHGRTHGFGVFNTTGTNQGFVCVSPHGYYGDFEIIERIYEQRVSTDPALRRWDQFFNWTSATRAVRARKDYCVKLLDKTVRSKDEPARICDVASGPCRDIFEFLSSSNDAVIRNSLIHCIDQDANAIRYAQCLLAEFSHQVLFENRNIFRCRLSGSYDLVWSAGLFDYLEDRMFVRLLTKLWGAVAPGGELVVGNFSPDNPHRGYMEFAGWHLIHRDENELLDLAGAAGLRGASGHVDHEPNGVNLFMHLKKDVSR